VPYLVLLEQLHVTLVVSAAESGPQRCKSSCYGFPHRNPMGKYLQKPEWADYNRGTTRQQMTFNAES
jgi:hypothetical protein